MPTYRHNTSSIISKPLGATEHAFSALVAATHTLCVAERDIAGLHHGDPAFDHWFRDAEAARSAVLAAADGVIMSMALTATDRRFRAVALSFEAMLLTSDAGKYARISEAMVNTRWLHTVPGRGPNAARATAMLRTFRRNLGMLLSYPDYTPDPSCASMPMAA